MKQSGREWNTKLNDVLSSLGFVACENETCLYQHMGKDNLSLILVYVDDLLIVCQSKEDLVSIKSAISNSFECVDKGVPELFLGMEVMREDELGPITIGHSQYIKELLQTHGMDNCRPAAISLDAGFQVNCADGQCQKVDPVKYQSMIGELMWLALTTRPDILHSVAKLSQRN